MLWRGRLLTASARARLENTTIQKRAACGYTKEREKKQQSKWFFLSFGGGRHFSEPKKDDGTRRCGEGASSVPQRARE